MGKLVELIVISLSVVLVVSTLTGSTNNYYNGKILTTILMDNIYLFELYQQQEPTGNKGITDCCKFSNNATLLINFLNF